MQRGKKMPDGVLGIVKRELKKEKRERIIEILLFSFVLVMVSLLLVFLSARLLMTGYAPYIDAQAGYITEVEMNKTFPTVYWHGTYGLALRVSNFSEQPSEDVQSGEITRKDLFFSCIEVDAFGGNEIYASLNDSIDFDNLQPATPAMVDAFPGCAGKTDCASNTFLQNSSIMVGATNITDIPFTYTYRYDGQNNIFGLGILNDSTHLVYVTHIESVQKGYSYEKTVNFQMLLPVPENETHRYYFFTDPYDTCPAGGVGEAMNATSYGYVKDIYGGFIENATVNIAGYSTLSDTSGFYNLSFLAAPGTYNVIATKVGYDTAFTNVTVNFTAYVVEKNITMYLETPGYNDTLAPYVYGYVVDESGNAIPDVNVSLAAVSTLSDSFGFYGFYPILVPGSHPIIALKIAYDNYYAFLNFDANTTSLNHNITMVAATYDLYIYPSGPYTSGPYTSGPYSSPPGATAAEERGEDYWISAKEIKKEVRQNTFIEEVVGIYNFKFSSMNLIFSLSSDIEDFVKLDRTSASISKNSFLDLIVTIYGTRPLGTYNGTLKISGDVEKEIPITIKIVEKRFPVETLLMEINLFKRVVKPGENLKYRLNLQNLIRDQGYKIALRMFVTDSNKSTNYVEDTDDVEILNSLTLLKEIKIPEDSPEGEYLLNVEAAYLNLISDATAPFIVSQPIYLYSLFGIPLWIIFLVISFFSFIFLNFLLYKKYKEKKKRYKVSLDYDTLPKPGDRVAKLGRVAETNLPVYYELDKLTTHTIVAGATGMGKSVSAQVLAEEALMNNIAVIVFDPTAQWSGMLRKCEDKKMLSFYPKFKLKVSDAKAFKGNVRQVENAREVIDVNKYMNPGEIQIFSLNKFDPKNTDIFVANVIRQIFKSDPKESPNLKLLIIFDEAHRLLARFGGTGEGFLQIERACREFRKWGIGVVLVSQALSDFVGEIKANINTEIQMRTIEESDLERIKVKYGETFLRSLVRASVGVGMFQNAEYNRGRPYFINFRPILHNTRRLSDEELGKYNKYNTVVEDLEYQIEQLEKEKIDTFDLKMELKLVKDKVMTGNFSVVEIYLEGLKPRVEKEWEKLGKKPKKREIQLVAEEEIRKSVEEAKKSREKWEKEEAKKAPKEEEKKEEVKLEEKEVKPLTFDNGIMVSSLKELKGVLPEFDPEIFKIHVNEKKNDVADWAVSISPELGEKLKGVKDKQELIDAIAAFEKGGVEEPAEKKEVKEGKGEKKEVEKGKKPEETGEKTEEPKKGKKKEKKVKK